MGCSRVRGWAVLKRESLNRQVDEELEHIPKHPKEHQPELRILDTLVARRQTLGEKAQRTQTAQEVPDYPN